MLKTLTIWNFALLEHVEIDFDRGLNILTGETGAGKSILIDAIGAILGKKFSTEMIRSGCEWSRIEAIFILDFNNIKIKKFLIDQAICIDDNTLIITRQITQKGHGTILVNGSHITVSSLKFLGMLLIDIHGQHDNLMLLKPENQFSLVDNNDQAIIELKQKYKTAFEQLLHLQQQFDELQASAQNINKQMDILQWQYQEITNANLKENEDEQLQNDIKKLSNAEKIKNKIEQSFAIMQGGNDYDGVMSSLSVIDSNFDVVSRYDSSISQPQKSLKEALFLLEDVLDYIRNSKDDLDFNPDILDDMQNRLDLIEKLKRKYGNSIEKILQQAAKFEKEISELENYDTNLEKLSNELNNATQIVKEYAQALSLQRKKTASFLSSEICKQLRFLGIQDASFNICINETDKLTNNGFDSINLLFSANPGEVPKPIEKIASGGELSRISLAIKVVSSNDIDSTDSMIFDEIDTGIGGKTAQYVAERIAIVAQHKQVLCITHLPQIACFADVHLYISKITDIDRTITQVQILTTGERIDEIARMTSGTNISSISLENAREMIDNAIILKNNIKEAVDTDNV